jgi:hypothetical protein
VEFSKNAQIPNLMKIRSVGAEFFRADERTDMAKLTGAPSNFAIAPKTCYIILVFVITLRI